MHKHKHTKYRYTGRMAKVFFSPKNGETFFSEVQKWRNFIFDQLMDFGHEKRITQNYDLLLSAYY